MSIFAQTSDSKDNICLMSARKKMYSLLNQMSAKNIVSFQMSASHLIQETMYFFGRQKKETCQNETRPIHTNLVYWSHFRKETCQYENKPVHTNLVYWSHFRKETCPYENRPIHTHLAFWYHFTHQTHTTVSF